VEEAMAEGDDSRWGSVLPHDAEEAALSQRSWRDDYTEKGTIGRGGFGRVIRVIDRGANVEVALKEPQATDPESLRRFRREVETQKSINHPNVMPILASGYSWFVMPVAESTLRAKAPEMFELEACLAFQQAAQGLRALHEKGLVHRDVKPENVLLLGEGGRRWVVSDLGLVRRPVDETTGQPTVGFWGTPDFAAPEALAGIHDLRPAADVYSLGRVVAWALTGRTNGKVPDPWLELVSRMTQSYLAERPSVDDVIRGLTEIREKLRLLRRSAWGKDVSDLSDDEVQVLGGVLNSLQTPEDDVQEVAFFHAIAKQCSGYLPGGVRIQLKLLETRGMIAPPQGWSDAWLITPTGWQWLFANQHRVQVRKLPSDDDVPF
jgi:serine/threonine protein kinase